MGTCHHGKVCTQVADGGEDFMIWRVGASMLNYQL